MAMGNNRKEGNREMIIAEGVIVTVLMCYAVLLGLIIGRHGCVRIEK